MRSPPPFPVKRPYKKPTSPPKSKRDARALSRTSEYSPSHAATRCVADGMLRRGSPGWNGGRKSEVGSIQPNAAGNENSERSPSASDAKVTSDCNARGASPSKNGVPCACKESAAQKNPVTVERASLITRESTAKTGRAPAKSWELWPSAFEDRRIPGLAAEGPVRRRATVPSKHAAWASCANSVRKMLSKPNSSC